MTETPESRIEQARRRASDAKTRLAVAATAAFVAVLGLAWASHPGKASSTGSSGASTSSDETESDDGFDNFDFGSSSIAPSGGGAPQVQSSVS